MTRQTGTSRAYLLERLRRDGRGDLLAAVGSGRLSAYAAAEAAGYVTRRPVIGTGSQGQAKRRAARGRDDGQLMELWLGPSQRGSRFRDEAELREAWAKNRDRLMEWWGSSGRRPMAWWEFEAGDLRYPGYDRERSFLFERGLFADAERAECHTGVRSSTAPTVPVSSTARVRGNFSTVMPPVAPTSRLGGHSILARRCLDRRAPNRRGPRCLIPSPSRRARRNHRGLPPAADAVGQEPVLREGLRPPERGARTRSRLGLTGDNPILTQRTKELTNHHILER